MTRQIVLLRGVNLGPRRRVPMPELRSLLGAAGFGDVRTYVASGNVVVSSPLGAAEVAERCSRLIEERFGFPVPVLVRSRDELAEVVALNPFGEIAAEPKLYQVTFLDREPDPELVSRIEALCQEPERFAAAGRELYTWHPDGIARSRLSARLASDRFLGTTGTARNWKTVTTLLSLADDA